ncbi:(5-formylfuran-3-yl)methyl phosphate synthase [Amycolatopsis keratiniphila]|uniref:(5-formylfuran-3-yl)methyl phosphate synthase n=1 Tax=Amycolatopsis keratiniphila subsp. keratiniphila TaxID=227715 RepID=A0A1W2M378_9PSEU|nr:(5-formylfuran-3-yl)methyl phosphate synthase [Amycolatopsis keratiniphila]ONF74506.1 hypothetical protein AVR91_0203625 [Amycolatopsis keratiniphila subsp. keratiniphila]
MRLLVSPESVQEALVCVEASEHLDVVDVKKPDEGSLGANYPWVIKEIRAAVPDDKLVSATLGDAPYKPGTMAQAALGATVAGADYIKVGLYGISTVEQGITLMRGVVRAVKDYRPDATVVAAGYADAWRIGAVNPLSIPYITRESEADGAMLDTAIKDGSTLFDHVGIEECASFVADSHKYNVFAALAGSIKSQHVADLVKIGTDVVGVRGAVCSGFDRNKGSIQPELVAEFKKSIDEAVAANATTAASAV